MTIALRLSNALALPAMLLAVAALPWPLSAQDAPVADAAPTVITVDPVVFDFEILATYPHDPDAFTQGLLWHDGRLYESTGQEGVSQVREVDLATGEVVRAGSIPVDQFGEGLALVGDELVSLTWHHGVIHRWSLPDLQLLRSTADYPFEGWGLTTLDGDLVASDGSNILRVLDPETYVVLREIPVTLGGQPLEELNELETIDGLIYANIWLTGFIVAIDPASGTVVRILDLRPLVESVEVTERSAVLNGIAYDAEGDRFFVTGKLWPQLYELRLIPRQP